MKEKGYLLRVLKHASIKKMSSAIRTVQKKSGKSSIAIFLDMLWCSFRYGAGYYDYQIFAFYNLNGKQRKTYMTRMISKKFNMFMNDLHYVHYFDNKDEFNKLFNTYIGREYCQMQEATKEEVRSFVSSKEYIFCKVKDKECGIGCEKIKVSDFETFDALYDYMQNKGFCTIEENVMQHDALNMLYPNAINCLRIITILDQQQIPHCIYAVQKMGYNGRVVDNNGLFSPVDMKTGKLLYPAHSGATTCGIVYTEHPDTHIKLVGYQIPYIKEAVDLCLKAALVVPQVRYVGWDVAITNDGPVIIEGNTYCAHDFWQLPPHTPNKTGIMPVIKKYVPDFKY